MCECMCVSECVCVPTKSALWQCGIHIFNAMFGGCLCADRGGCWQASQTALCIAQGLHARSALWDAAVLCHAGIASFGRAHARWAAVDKCGWVVAIGEVAGGDVGASVRVHQCVGWGDCNQCQGKHGNNNLHFLF